MYPVLSPGLEKSGELIFHKVIFLPSLCLETLVISQTVPLKQTCVLPQPAPAGSPLQVVGLEQEVECLLLLWIYSMLFTYLLLAVLDLHYCMGISLVAGRGLLAVVATLLQSTGSGSMASFQ